MASSRRCLGGEAPVADAGLRLRGWRMRRLMVIELERVEQKLDVRPRWGARSWRRWCPALTSDGASGHTARTRRHHVRATGPVPSGVASTAQAMASCRWSTQSIEADALGEAAGSCSGYAVSRQSAARAPPPATCARARSKRSASTELPPRLDHRQRAQGFPFPAAHPSAQVLDDLHRCGLIGIKRNVVVRAPRRRAADAHGVAPAVQAPEAPANQARGRPRCPGAQPARGAARSSARAVRSASSRLATSAKHAGRGARAPCRGPSADAVGDLHVVGVDHIAVAQRVDEPAARPRARGRARRAS